MTKRIISIILSLSMIMGLLAYLPLTASAEGASKEYQIDSMKIEYTVNGSWDQNQTIRIRITNTGETPLSGWALKYDATGTIKELYNADILANEESNYILSGKDNTRNIEPGQSVSFGYTLTGENMDTPNDWKLVSSVAPVDSESYDVAFKINDEWSTGYTGQIIITNKSKEVLNSWSLSFNCNSEITSLWDAKISKLEDGSYVVVGSGYNSSIPAGQSLTLGFNGTKTESVEANNFVLSSIVVDKNLNPYEPPTEETGVDSDEDGLSDYQEVQFGTDPFNPDTDDDGLTDYEEVYLTKTDPLKMDTDGNGVSDADEDPDHDGLTNIQEIKLGTSPLSDDTDMDGLKDGDEVNKYGTDPLKYDTDEDGVSDGDEIIIDLDPLNPKTHGVPDNEYTFEQTLSIDEISINEELSKFKVEIDMKASNNAKNILVNQVSGYNHNLSQNRAVIDSAIELSYDRGTVESGKIRFVLDKSYLKNSPLYPELNLGLERYCIFMFDESINTICPVPCEYDKDNGIISVNASEFMGNLCVIDIESLLYDMGVNLSVFMSETVPTALSLGTNMGTPVIAESDSNDYDNINDNSIINDITEDELDGILLGKTNTNNMFRSITVPPQNTVLKQADLVFVLDTTGSMGSAIGKVKTQLASLISKLRTNGVTLNVAMVDYKDITNGEKTVTHGFSNNIDSISSMLNSIRVTGGGDALETAVDGLGAAAELPFAKSSRFVFLITDAGTKNNNNYGYSGIEDVANALKRKNVYCSVIANSIYGYQPLVNNTDGKFIVLSSNFSQAMYDFMLSKSKEKSYNAILSSNLKQITLNEDLTYMGPCDTDGDGLTDSEETNWSLIPGFNSEDIDKDVVLELPTLAQLLNDREYYNEFLKNPALKIFLSTKCLPIKSDPTEIDSDGDGFMDSIKNFDSKGYYNVSDKWPLTSAPKAGVCQQDGEFYFDKLSMPETNVGGRKYSAHSGSLPNEEQKLVYNMCKELTVEPNLVFAMALHESGFNADAKNNWSTASGYMQLLDRTWNYYALPDGAYHGAYKDVLNKYEIDLSNKNNPKSNLAVGTCCLAQCRKEKGEDASLRTVVGYYGEGYEAASTLEVIEYYETITSHLKSLFEL